MKRSGCLHCVAIGLSILCSALKAASAHSAPASFTNLLPNPGFEAGAAQPDGWRLIESGGAWVEGGRSGQKAISVQGNGTGSTAWRQNEPSTRPGAVYRFRFWGKREPGCTGGTTISGLSRVNNDFELDATWREYGFAFRSPDDAADYLRLGQWEVRGGIRFDDVSLVPAAAVHESVGDGCALGEGEALQAGVYHFRPDYTWRGANVHRPLVSFTCGFNSGRWLFPSGGELIYRFAPGFGEQRSARVEAGIEHFAAGGLWVEASREGAAWVTIGRLDGGKKNGTFDVAKDWFPAREIWIRLRQADSGGYLQMTSFRYEAAMSGAVPDAVGSTRFVDVLQENPGLKVVPVRLRAPDDAGVLRLELLVTNVSTANMTLRGGWLLSKSGGRRPLANLAPGTAARLDVSAPLPPPGTRRERLRLTSDRAVVYEAELEFTSGFLARSDFGTRLHGVPGLDLWWCESGWKVGRERPVPVNTAIQPMALSAAGGEFEAVQVVLHPSRAVDLLGVEVRQKPVRGSEALEVRCEEVAYVNVLQPTDWSCQRGWYPDPLPPLKFPMRLEAGRNQPIWVTFRVPSRSRGGTRRGEVVLRTSLGEVLVPWRLEVYGFEMPRDTHLRSALGLGAGSINDYHGLGGAPEAKRRQVFEGYLQNFAEHRISPYSFFDYDPIDVRFEGEGPVKHAVVDFRRFDAAAERWIDGARFNTFSLPLHGMGGGTFQSRSLGRLEGFEEGTPEHARLFQDYLGQVEAHLRDKGWLDEAFTYWFDEPDPKDYEFVVAGMKRIKAAAPGLRRMLTEQPEPALMGHVDIWCGLTPEWSVDRVKARRNAGEDVWWYICTGPKAPFVTEFIDHPGTELRLWPWQSWQYGVRGILIWATLYWNSPAAFPPPRRQDPWADPMSYVSGYDFGPGTIGYWGNGDGRFLYPPRRDAKGPQEPVMDAPINSVRWEGLRDGMEDYEYFWLLEQQIQRLEKSGRGGGALLGKARALLVVPRAVSEDLTHFTTDPRVMLAHRDAVARMIERLGAIR